MKGLEVFLGLVGALMMVVGFFMPNQSGIDGGDIMVLVGGFLFIGGCWSPVFWLITPKRKQG